MAPQARQYLLQKIFGNLLKHTMKIEKNSAVTLRFKVTDRLGKVVEESKEPMVYLHGGYGNTLPKIEEALDGQVTGFKTTLDLSAADAFGVRDESLVQTIPKTQFPPGVKVGGQLEGHACLHGHEDQG
jgi:FKBP-type peptidyl-prolyl cis-trans isomerase SlyD